MLPLGARIADRVTAFVGSWRFILIQSAFLIGWIIGNGTELTSFDPYPFILLNLFLSFQAAYTAPFIMMSQNRQAEVDRITMHSDYQIDQETSRKIDLVMDEVRALRLQLETSAA